MRALVQHGYGDPVDVLDIVELDRPTPGPREVLVRVEAASVNPADWHLVRGEPLIARLAIGLLGPKHQTLGCDLAGQVVEVGAGVDDLSVGDAVFGSCFPDRYGAFAEYAVVSCDRVLRRPGQLTAVEAAALPLAGATALQALLDHGRLTAGRRVLIIGATGGVGSLATQIATHLDAEVTAVVGSGNIDFASSLGAVHVRDYRSDTVVRRSDQFDLIVQLGGRASATSCCAALAPAGTLLMLSGDSDGRAVGPLPRLFRGLARGPFRRQQVKNFTVKPTRHDLTLLRSFVCEGALKPIVERCVTLEEAPSAIGDVQRGHTRGKVVVAIT